MIKWFFIFLFGGIATVAISLYFKLGGYKKVQIQLSEMPSMTLLYKKHYGAYYQISPTIQAVENWAIENDYDCSTSFGAYLDDPKLVEEDRLNSQGGCVITNPVEKSKLPLDFEQRTVQKQKYIVARFMGSPSIGPFVVYPEVERWAEEKRLNLQLPYYETYKIDENKVTTTYLFLYK